MMALTYVKLMLHFKAAALARVFGVALVGVGLVFMALSWLYWRDLRRCAAEEPLSMSVDLSQSGEFSKDFVLEYPYGYGYALQFLLPDAVHTEPEREDSVADLKVNCSIFRSGERLRYSEFRGGVMEKTGSGRSMRIMYIGPRLPKGKYTCTLRVLQGAHALSGIEQRVVMVYLISMDVMGVFVYLYWSVIALAGAILCIGLAHLTRGEARDSHLLPESRNR